MTKESNCGCKCKMLKVFKLLIARIKKLEKEKGEGK